MDDRGRNESFETRKQRSGSRKTKRSRSASSSTSTSSSSSDTLHRIKRKKNDVQKRAHKSLGSDCYSRDRTKKEYKKHNLKKKRKRKHSSSDSDNSCDFKERKKHKSRIMKKSVDISNDSSDDKVQKLNKQTKKKRRKKSHHDTSSDTESSSSGSSVSSTEMKKVKKRKKDKKKKKKKKKEKKLAKIKKKETESMQSALLKASNEVVKLADEKPSEKSHIMKPMTKEEWEKQQSVVQRIYDPETGRNRLVKGDGEILEEIVSKERHKEINKQATLGDGIFYATKMGIYK